MALLDEVLGGWSGGIVVGLGAAVLVPTVIPIAGTVIRPVAKTLVQGGLLLGSAVSGLFAAASAQVDDLVTEIRTETHRGRPASAHR